MNQPRRFSIVRPAVGCIAALSGSPASSGLSTLSVCASSPDSYISITMSHPPTSSPLTNSCGIVGQLEIAESSWRMRGSGSTSTAANGASRDCNAATVRALKPQAGASGLPFMNRIVGCSAIASAIASRMGFVSGSGMVRLLTAGGWLCDERLQRQRVDRAADLAAEHVIHEAMLLDATAPHERLRAHRRAEVIAAARVVLDLRTGSRDRCLDTLLQLLGGRHLLLNNSSTVVGQFESSGVGGLA